MKNIYRVLDMVVQTNGQRMLTALEEAFDLICSLSAENSTAGEKWKTNANYMVNRRFIVDYITEAISMVTLAPLLTSLVVVAVPTVWRMFARRSAISLVVITMR